MLQFKLTPHHAGVTLWGDFEVLDRLHNFIHHVVNQSVHIEDKEGFVLGLAYDLRKAFQGQRSQDYRTHSEDDRCCIYGVEVLWPLLLVQVGVLRQAIAFTPTSKLDQALMFELEYVVESALRMAIPVTADEVIQRMSRIGSAPYMHVDNVLDSRCRYFIELPAKQRLVTIPKLMETFDPMYGFLASVRSGVKSDIIPPGAFVNCKKKWPDFKW